MYRIQGVCVEPRPAGRRHFFARYSPDELPVPARAAERAKTFGHHMARMSADRWATVSRLTADAMEIPAAERAAWLAHACGAGRRAGDFDRDREAELERGAGLAVPPVERRDAAGP